MDEKSCSNLFVEAFDLEPFVGQQISDQEFYFYMYENPWGFHFQIGHNSLFIMGPELDYNGEAICDNAPDEKCRANFRNAVSLGIVGVSK